MTSQNPTKPLTPIQDDAEQTASERPEVKKELSDDEIAAVAGGYQVVKNPSSNNGSGTGTSRTSGGPQLF